MNLGNGKLEIAHFVEYLAEYLKIISYFFTGQENISRTQLVGSPRKVEGYAIQVVAHLGGGS